MRCALPLMGRPGPLCLVGPRSVRFGAVTGRHRGQPSGKSAEDAVDERAPRGRRRGVLAAVSVVFVLLAAVVVFGFRDGPVSEEPRTATTSVRQVGPVTSPADEPTYGEYVPPEPGPQVATKAPPRPAPVPRTTPRKTKPAPIQTPTSTPTPTRTRRECPPQWRDSWWMRRWCDGPRDRDGHRGR